MARTLTFTLGGNEYAVSPERIDRKKLYGWNETLALDENSEQCRLVSMDESGTVIIPPKGTGLGCLSPDNKWVDKTELKAVYSDGTDAVIIPSSYTVTVELKDKVTVDEYLDHTITAFYQLTNASTELINELKDTIYAFDYCYSDSYDTSRAFLIENGDAVFMLIGTPSNFELLGIEESSAVNEDDEEPEEDSDELDFSSMF